MKLCDKLAYLQDNHFNEWLTTRQAVAQEISERQEVFCVCGRLATGFHEQTCRKLNNKITSETVKRLKHLFSKEVTTDIGEKR